MNALILSLMLMQCPGGQCAPMAPAWSMPATSTRWEQIGNLPEYALIANGRQLGSWNVDRQTWRARYTNGWGPVESPPLPVPANLVMSRDRPVDVPLEPKPEAKPPAAVRESAELAEDAKPRCKCCPSCKCTDCKCKDGSRCGAPCCKCGAKAELPPSEENFGVDRSKIRADRTSVNGRELAMADGIKAISGGVPDDSKLLSLTMIGSPEECKQVRDDLEGSTALKPLKDHFLIQDYRPDDVMIRPGFVKTGHPAIYVQDPAGGVVSRQDKYYGPDNLAVVLVTARRLADPNYHPERDPDLSHGAPILPAMGSIPLWVWIAGGGLLIVLLMRQRRID